MSNTWSANVEDFATRMTLGDFSGFFSKQLVVMQGTHAMIIDDGTYLGVVPPGTYTLQTFIDKLKFWRSAKQVDVVLTRDDDVRVDLVIGQLATAEELLVSVRLQLIVQITDVTLFTKNLLGNRTGMTIQGIADWIMPILTQALRDSVRQLSIAALTSPKVRAILATALQDATKTSLLRYGISCIDIHTTEIVNEQYDEQRKKTGEIFLLDMTTQQQKKLDEVLDKDTFRKIEQREREIELEVLAEHVEIDKSEADVALAIRRTEVRKNMRDAMQSDKFDEIKSEGEFDAFMLEIDKEKLLRDDERDELQKIFNAKKEDRDTARTHLVRQLELRRNAELDDLSANIAQAQRIKTLEHEIAMTKLTESEENRQWQDSLEREKEQAAHNFEMRLTEMKRQQELNSKNASYLREEEWQQLLQKQKTARLEREIAEDSQTRDVRIRRIRDEYDDEQKRREYALLKGMMDDQIGHLRVMEEMNREREAFQAKLLLDAATRINANRIAELNAMSQMSVEALIATSDSANAKILGDVQISKNESAAQTAIREQGMQRERELQDQRVQDAQASNVATLDAIQKITGQAFGAIGQFGGGNATPGLGAVSPGTPGVIVCPGCRTDNNPVNKFCAKCGKEL